MKAPWITLTICLVLWVAFMFYISIHIKEKPTTHQDTVYLNQKQFDSLRLEIRLLKADKIIKGNLKGEVIDLTD